MHRKGISLVEVMVVMLLVGSVLLNAVGLCCAGASGTQGIADQASVRNALYNLCEILRGLPVDQLRVLCSAAGKQQLQAILGQILDDVSSSSSRFTRIDSVYLVNNLSVSLEEPTSGSTLMHVELTVRAGCGQGLTLHVLQRQLPSSAWAS